MVGPELTVGGWFATSIIRNVMDKARSALGSNHALQTEIENRLTDLEKNSLPLLDAIFEEASKSPIKNRGLIKWMDNLRNEAYKIRDGLDYLEAKRFRESLKGKNKVTKFGYSTGKYLKTLIFSDSELEAFKSAVDEFCKIFMRLPEFINLLHEHRTTATTEHNNTNRWETSSYLDPDAMIFGRDTEIYFILDIILNCQLVCFPNGNQDERERRESTSEVGREGKFQERGKIKSSEVGREGTSQKKSYIKSSEIAQSKKEKSTESEQNSVCISDWKLPVLPIYGLGGVGKTTIAKIVYNNKEVVEGFDLRVWVYISKKFDVKIIMKNIVESVQGSIATGENLDSLSKQTIKCKLIKTITNKRFFLVLDDVHDHDGIESILSEDLFPILRNGAPGSFVLITTQSEPVAKTIGNMPNIISLDVLEPEWFLLLFKYYAFGELFSFDKESGSSSISCKNNTAKAQLNNLTEVELSDLESIATKIAEKLHGLPLAGRVIGKMLYTKLDKSHWNKTLKSNWWDDESTSREILASLSIGYKDLDPDVQQCFRFCSIFPKHYEFDRNTLVQMWMAHDDDFIQPNLGDLYKMETRLENIGKDRFDKLVERSFFQPTVNDGKYVMHDLIRELAIAVSQKQKFYHVESLHDKIPKVTHHMGIYCDGSYMKEKITLFNPVDTNLKTLILFGNLRDISEQSFSNFVGKSKGLRLLDLSNAKMMPQPSKEKTKSRPRASKHIVSSSNRYMPMLVDNICQLSHLRFLDLSFSDAHFLPNEFCQLYHLQVLDLRGLNFLELPKHMNKLVNLRHLYGSANTLSRISGIGKLTNLQELKEFCIRESNGHRISELRDMNEISGHLLLSNLENVSTKEEAATCQLDKKRYLKSLELTFITSRLPGHVRLELEVLEALKPSPSVEMLTISGGRGDSLPGWLCSTQSGFSNLKCIKVSDCELTALPAFGELPFLEILIFNTLHFVEMVGDEFYGRSCVVFPSLKELQFSGMSRWRTWSDAPAGKKSFPVLKKIHLHFSNFVQIPVTIFTSSVAEFTLLLPPGNFNNIETVMQRMPHLNHLSITGVLDDVSIDCTGLRLLEVLCLKNVRHIHFLGGIKSLVNLRKLDMAGFNEIRELFEEEEENHGTCQENRLLTSLNLNYLSHSHKSYYGILPLAGRLGYLRSLLIRSSPVTEYAEEEGSWFSQLTSLETLKFYGCSELRGLPSTLPLLTKLKKLTIANCPKISSLPEFGLPPYLTELYITGCSDELVRRCQPKPDQGDDWWKISHIPHILIKQR